MRSHAQALSTWEALKDERPGTNPSALMRFLIDVEQHDILPAGSWRAMVGWYSDPFDDNEGRYEVFIDGEPKDTDEDGFTHHSAVLRLNAAESWWQLEEMSWRKGVYRQYLPVRADN